MRLAVILTLVCATLVMAETSPPAHTQRPVLDYRARYATHFLPNEVLLVMDTSEGVIYTTRQSRSTLSVWRKYDLTEIAKEETEKTLPALNPAYSNATVHGRYTLTTRGDILIFTDTLTSRIWACRHSEGLLDVWKCYDPGEKVE